MRYVKTVQHKLNGFLRINLYIYFHIINLVILDNTKIIECFTIFYEN